MLNSAARMSGPEVYLNIYKIDGSPEWCSPCGLYHTSMPKTDSPAPCLRRQLPKSTERLLFLGGIVAVAPVMLKGITRKIAARQNNRSYHDSHVYTGIADYWIFQCLAQGRAPE